MRGKEIEESERDCLEGGICASWSCVEPPSLEVMRGRSSGLGDGDGGFGRKRGCLGKLESDLKRGWIKCKNFGEKDGDGERVGRI